MLVFPPIQAPRKKKRRKPKKSKKSKKSNREKKKIEENEALHESISKTKQIENHEHTYQNHCVFDLMGLFKRYDILF